MRTLALAAALVALTACGKPLLYAEVEIPSVRVFLPQQDFPSTINPQPADLCTDGTVPAGVSCLQKSVEYDLGSDFRDLTKDSLSYDLRLTDLGITLTSGLGDFGDVKRVVLSVDGTAGLPSVDLATYEWSAANPTPSVIVVGARSNVNLGPYLQDGRIIIRTRMEFGRDIPAFTADVAGTFYLRVTLDYGHELGIL